MHRQPLLVFESRGRGAAPQLERLRTPTHGKSNVRIERTGPKLVRGEIAHCATLVDDPGCVDVKRWYAPCAENWLTNWLNSFSILLKENWLPHVPKRVHIESLSNLSLASFPR